MFTLDGRIDLATAIAKVADEYELPEQALRDRLLPQLHELGLRGFLRLAPTSP